MWPGQAVGRRKRTARGEKLLQSSGYWVDGVRCKEQRTALVVQESSRRCIEGGARLDDVAEEDPGAERVAVGDDGLIAVVAHRDAFLAVPAVELHAAAAALQHL